MASGHVNRERLRRAELGDQPLERLVQVSYSSLAGTTLTAVVRTSSATVAPDWAEDRGACALASAVSASMPPCDVAVARAFRSDGADWR